MIEVLRDALLQRIERAEPRLLALVAPAGYGKSTLARQIARQRERSATCDCFGCDGALDFSRRLLTALATEMPERASSLARRKLILGRDGDGTIDLAVDAASSSAGPSVLVIDNAEHLFPHARALSLLRRVVAVSPPERRIVICSRAAIPTLAHQAAPHEVIELGAADMRFDDAELTRVFDGVSIESERLESLKALTGGWPMAALLLRSRAREGDLDEILFYLRGATGDALDRYIREHVVDASDDASFAALAACAAIPQATREDIRLLVDDAVFERLAHSSTVASFIEIRDGRISLHPLLRASIARHERDLDDLRLRCARGWLEGGDFIRAAQLFMSANAGDDAAAALERPVAALFTGASPAPELFSALASLDAESLIRHPLLWIVVNAERIFPGDPSDWAGRVEPVWRGLDRDANPIVLLNVFASLATCYVLLGRFDDAEALLEEYRARVPSLGFGEKITIAAWSSYLPALRGDLELAARLIPSAMEIVSMNPISEAMFRYDVLARVARLRGDREEERAQLDEALALARGNNLFELERLILCDAAFGAFLSGDEQLFDAHVATLSEVGADASYDVRAFVAAARGADWNDGGSFVLPTIEASACIVNAVRAAERERALAFAERAVRAADVSNQPFHRIVSRIALAHLTEAGDRLALEASAIARESGLAALADEVRNYRGVIDGLRAPKAVDAAIEVSLLEGAFRRDGARKECSPREWELLALLALRPSMSTEELAATLYPDNDDAAARNALKVLVRRVRVRLGERAVEMVGSGYRLSGMVEVDVSRCERALRDGDRSQKAAALDLLRSRRTGRLLAREWFVREERRLAELEQGLARDLARTALERGETSAALGYARAATAIDPYDEAACEIIMRALLNAGRDGEAIREYRDYHNLMMRELGVAPSPALRALFDAARAASSAAP